MQNLLLKFVSFELIFFITTVFEMDSGKADLEKCLMSWNMPSPIVWLHLCLATKQVFQSCAGEGKLTCPRPGAMYDGCF